MSTRSLLVAAGIAALLTVPLAAANPLACAPGSFPTKPVPGGVVGDAWDAAASAYDGSPAAGACVQDPTPNPYALADEACDLLIGESCYALLQAQNGTTCTKYEFYNEETQSYEMRYGTGTCFEDDGRIRPCVPFYSSVNNPLTLDTVKCASVRWSRS
jgi:hypothetical protein